MAFADRCRAIQLGAGISFERSLFELPARLGVSLDYMLQRVTVKGDVVYVTEPVVTDPRTFVINRLGGSDTESFHYLGPRFEIEFPVARGGPFEISVLGELGGYFALSETSHSLTASNGVDTARFEIELDPWIAQAGVGIRVSWRGGR